MIKAIGIYMDHSKAHLIDFALGQSETKTVVSTFTNEEKKVSLGKSEQLMHNKEQHEQAAYYKQLGETIKRYDHVLLCGPTHAKSELHNVLIADHRFSKIKIAIRDTDKMTDNQQYAFVKEYFTNCL